MSSSQADSQSQYVYEEAPSTGAAPPAAPATTAAPRSLLERILAHTTVAAPESGDQLAQFLAASSMGRQLELWFGSLAGLDREQIVLRLNRDVAYIDQLLNEQVDRLIHHPQFQKLEAIWRGVEYLLHSAEREGAPDVKIRLLNASWRDLERDFERAVEFDQSALFKKVYEAEFGAPGGEPFGALIGDYEVQPSTHPHDDMMVLGRIAQVAAAAFCPFIAGASPAMFGLDSWTGLEPKFDLAKGFGQPEFIKWNALRDSEDARFVGLTLPRVLLRRPLADDTSRRDGFRFDEHLDGRRDRYLWGNAAFAMGEVLIRAYSQTGWLANIRGVERGVEAGGLVTGLPVHHFATDAAGVAPKASTEVVISDELEKSLSDLGFIPLCHCYDTEFSAFYSNQSIQRAKKYDRPVATANARISSMLQYMLCVSRFAHYVKVIVRDKIGTMQQPAEIEDQLNRWLAQYVTPNENASPEVRARYPLREGRVQLRESPGQPGAYQAIIHLWPHFELDELHGSVRVATELAPPQET